MDEYEEMITLRGMRERTKVLDVLATDPDGWVSPEARLVGRVIFNLREKGMADTIIYEVVRTIQSAQERER